MRAFAALAALLLARHAAARSAPDAAALAALQPLLLTDALTPLERALPPFTALDLGGTGCWPLSVHVAPGPHALLLEGADEVRRSIPR